MINFRGFSFATMLILLFSTSISAQVTKINLEQTPGVFTTESLTLIPGDYQFAIANNGVGHDVGFVLAPKGMTEAKSHIKEAYVTAPAKTGQTSMTNVVSLTPGEYVYFCPLNPTKEYDLTVNEATTIKLEQVKGEFTVKGLTLSPGDYQFEIANGGVDHEVGFVLAPKGMTEAKNHIKEAYVKTPVKTGMTSMTNVVSLEAGEYVYFCPLNPTKENTLIVK